MAKHLITQRRFLPYFCTQFLGAFNDNVYRYAFAILITYFLAEEHRGVYVNSALVAFILPFFLFGAITGQLADKYEKAWLIRHIKLAEIVIMLGGCIALYFQNVPGMLAVLFALGAQSSFFGPIKYSILPQHVKPNEILNANAYVEAGTFIAILLGQVLGGALSEQQSYLPYLMVAIVSFAVLGWFSARMIPDAPAASPDLKLSFNIFTKTVEIIKMARADHGVFQSILANSWFWFFGALVLTLFPIFAIEVLNGNPKVAIVLLATFTVGIALGSFACSIFSAGRVELGLVPIGALGMSLFTWNLSSAIIDPGDQMRTLVQVLAEPGVLWALFNLVMIAFFAGLFIVPLYTYMQTKSCESKRSRIIAVNNIINSLFMIVAGGLGIALDAAGFSVMEIFKIVAILNLIVALYILSQIPEYFLRLVSWLLAHCVYRIRKEDLDKIPETGPALLVCNHVSFFDPPILLGVLPRPARFVMWYGFYELPIAGRLFRWLKSIPIGNRRERPELVKVAFDTIAEELQAGRLVVVFPEGAITRDGEVSKFQPGIDEILKRTPVPVIPLALRGVWGTWSSRKRGSALKGWPTGFMKKLTVVAGDPVAPEDATRLSMHDKVKALRGDEK
ncbi:MAG: 1-acyl-sn-glycerol-3-phosphate acyltransferase [Arenicella sp.]|jgi:1-acyl-sn-glycerol-3-phosphate acyltransferase